jgi:hypothetical protein
MGKLETQEIKYMDIKEFRQLGLLVEINRLFLHPLGLALEVAINKDNKEYIQGIWDCREDPSGIIYHSLNLEKIEKAQGFIKKQHENRMNTLGYIIQEQEG